MDIKIDGLDGIIKSVEDIADTTEIVQAMKKACAIVESSAKEKAPKTSKSKGVLKNSITSTVDIEGGEIIGKVYTPLFYAPYVCFGTGLGAYEEYGSGKGRTDVPWTYQDENGKWHTTSGMSPQPFLRPALYENTEMVKNIIKVGLIK